MHALEAVQDSPKRHIGIGRMIVVYFGAFLRSPSCPKPETSPRPVLEVLGSYFLASREAFRQRGGLLKKGRAI